MIGRDTEFDAGSVGLRTSAADASAALVRRLGAFERMYYRYQQKSTMHFCVVAELADDAILLRAPLSEALTPISFAVVAQLVALSLARRRGRDVERPRGLSKVTRTR